MGANIGTTVTALLASLAVSGANASAGVHIALVHLLFNLAGHALADPTLPADGRAEYPSRAPSGWPTRRSGRRRWALLYVVILFYAVLGQLAALHRVLTS